MWREQKNLKFRKFQKNRINRFISHFSTRNKSLYSLIFTKGFHFFSKHLKIMHFFLQKRLSKSRHMSKKEMYKRINSNSTGVRLLIRTHDFMRKSSKSTFSYLNKRERKHVTSHTMTKNKKKNKKHIFLNSIMFPYTRKPVGSRMGKGKGSVKFWFFFVKPGAQFLQFLGWSPMKMFRFWKTLRTILPGKPILRSSFFRISSNIRYSSNLNISFYMLKKIFNEKNFSFFCAPMFSWFEISQFWQFCWSQYYLDEIISRLMINNLNNLSRISTYVLDRWFSYWSGWGIWKFVLKNISDFGFTRGISGYNFILLNFISYFTFFILFISLFFLF
jgi:hypothetical protein